MNKILALILLPVLCFSQPQLNQADAYILEKEYFKAEELLVSHVKRNPNDLRAIEQLGDAYGYQEKWDEAINEYLKLVNAMPEVANYHYKYGGVLAMKALEVNKLRALTLIGDIKDAFSTAARLDVNHINVRWALVELYMQLPAIIGGSQSKSLSYANELEALSKVDGYLAKGYIYEYGDEPELAEKFYKMAIMEGGSVTCFEKLSNFYVNTKAPNKAITTLEASHAKHQRNALHYQIGKVAAEYNIQLDKGRKCLLTYIENYSAEDGVPIAWAHFRLAQIYRHQKDKTSSLLHIEQAIEKLPKIDVFKLEKLRILEL